MKLHLRATKRHLESYSATCHWTTFCQFSKHKKNPRRNQDIGFVGNLILNTSCGFHYNDITVP